MTNSSEPTTVRLDRTLPASPAEVYRAWLEPDRLVRWLGPGPYTAARAEVEPQVGGRHRIWHADADGNDMGGSEGVFVDLVPDERISMTFHFVGPDRETVPVEESLLTITLTPGTEPGTTRLVLEHERLDGLLAAHAEVGQGVADGWADVLGKLDHLLRTGA